MPKLISQPPKWTPESLTLPGKKQLADYLGVTVSHINHLMQRGQLAYIRVGKCVRFTLEELKLFLNPKLRA